MSDLINRLKQILDDISDAIDNYEKEERKVDNKAIDEVAIRSIRRQLSYLKQFHDDQWIANKIGVKKRQLRRWEAGANKPAPNHGWALKALYDKERILHGEDI